ILAATGCKDKPKPAKQPPPAATAKPPSDPAVWIARLAELPGSAPLHLQDASGVVGIAADGSLSVGKTTPDAATTLDALPGALGIAPAAPRPEVEFLDVVGNAPGLENPTDIKFAKLGHPALATGSPPPPHRLTSAFAIAHPDEVSGGVIVFADANAPAAVLVTVLSKVGGFVAVRDGKNLTALPLAIDRQPPAATRPDQRWSELRLGPTNQLEKVPAQATAVTFDELAAKVAALDSDAIDILVAPETKVGDLVRAVAQLRAAKVDAMGLGKAPAVGTPDANARGKAGPRVTAWNFSVVSVDKVDPAPLRAAFDATLERMQQCYAKQVKGKQQTAELAFVVGVNQKLGKLEANGVDAAIGKCIGEALKLASFPKSGANPVQVEARVTFSPE
ncbi:MAG TPA: hypothetical protein VIV40_29490, partial [Kofleriaceae bacterium]